MSAFYIMRYFGGVGMGTGFGAIYIGRGTIVGADSGNGRYRGSYTETGGRMRGDVTLSWPSGGNLVTGQQVPAGISIPMSFDWPVNFTSGPQPVAVRGRTVNVTFEKVGDVP